MDAMQAVLSLNDQSRDDKDAIVIPKWILRLVNHDLLVAMFLKQCVYLDSYFNNPQGFFQTYPQWQEDSSLTRYQVDSALKTVNKLADRDIVTTQVLYINGANRKHYKVQWDALYAWFCEKQQNVLQKTAEPSAENHTTFCEKPLDILNRSTNKSSQTEEVKPSSSQAPAAPSTPAVQEEKISKSPAPILAVDEVLIKAFARLCKVPVTDPKLPHLLRQIQAIDPPVTSGDFRAFQMYYEAVRDPKFKDRYESPAPLYVLNGWARFVEWWKAHHEESVFGYLPGVEDTVNLSRWAWASFEDWPIGEGVLSPRRGGMVFYAKQADGTFMEVPRAEWPAWAKESA